MNVKQAMQNHYELLDSGEERKLERFSDVVIARPCAQASWAAGRPDVWTGPHISFDHELGWRTHGGAVLPDSWVVTINDISLRLKPTPAGHLGVFPETRTLWSWIGDTLGSTGCDPVSVLNLFAYSGGATLAAARTGCSVCHVDSSKSMVTRARENAALNGLEDAPIRWIVEDVGKFLDREIRRKRTYDAIMLDPPSFGHGTKGEQYRIDRDLLSTLQRCKALLSETPAFVLLTSHTQGMTAMRLEGLMQEVLGKGDVALGDMELSGEGQVRPVNCGVWARWTPSISR